MNKTKSVKSKEEDLFPQSSDSCILNLTLRPLPAREISRLF